MLRLDIIGDGALSPFRLKAIADKKHLTEDEAAGLQCRYLFLIQCNQQPTEAQLQALCRLLDHGGPTPTLLNDEKHQPDVFITPRQGTQSPWGTKALAVAREANFDWIDAIERGRVWYLGTLEADRVIDGLYDPMTESIATDSSVLDALFAHHDAVGPRRLAPSDFDAIAAANTEWGCALSDEEMHYLAEYAEASGHHYSDAELIMFGQVNSEHCRHKIFNGEWLVDGKAKEDSLFGLIRKTHEKTPQNTLVAYKDNGSVVQGKKASMLFVDQAQQYCIQEEDSHLVIKVETHNHPTAISPFAGAATGSGGEIRDEGATGTAARPKAGMVGFTTSDLRIDGFGQAWELEQSSPERIATPQAIMLEGPIGAASFNNEFGRPSLVGYFRTLEMPTNHNNKNNNSETRWGYHKPIMIAGGVGTIRPSHVEKHVVSAKMKLLVLGGPGMRIGMGGGAASSAPSEDSRAELDYASVQRSNPEMERRCQEVINKCRSLGTANPIVMIHDVGAGGLSNALPELVESGGCGAEIDLEAIPVADTSLSPVEIWCNESQERYVLALKEDDVSDFLAICARERCPVAIVGVATESEQICVHSQRWGKVVDLPCHVLFHNPPALKKEVKSEPTPQGVLADDNRNLDEMINSILALPSVAAKHFLITIGDRSISGQVHRDQMVGPWQVPVADCAVTLADYTGYHGEVMSVGERPLVAITNAAASVRLSVAEAITNLFAAPIDDITSIKLSANWMAACGDNRGDSALREGVEAISQFCCDCNLAIPVGKDSLSMRVEWDGGDKSVVSPLSLVVTAFAPLSDVRKTLTPQLENLTSTLYLIDIGDGQYPLGSSALMQTLASAEGACADVSSVDLDAFMKLMVELHAAACISAYHDKGDGGLFVTLVEMMFASRVGLDITLDAFGEALTDAQILFNESIGVVVQVAEVHAPTFDRIVQASSLAKRVKYLGTLAEHDRVRVQRHGNTLFEEARAPLEDRWQMTSWHMKRLRDEPLSADEEREASRLSHAGLAIVWPENMARPDTRLKQAPMIGVTRPTVAILRDAGVNSHQEMAAAFMAAGFDAIDVPMSDLRSGRQQLSSFQGLAACGGFSYGDVLGAGLGWAKSILVQPALREQFAAFFQDSRSFSLGVCNGCQMLSGLREIIPGSEHWPNLRHNRSEQFEGRTTMVRVPENNSVLFGELAGAQLPIAVAHMEGRMEFEDASNSVPNNSITMQYAFDGTPTERYPFNPNGSPQGITGLSDSSGRINIVMPHPERNFTMQANSYVPPQWREEHFGPWFELFLAARRFCL